MAATPAPNPGTVTYGGVGREIPYNVFSNSAMNSLRISDIIDSIYAHLRYPIRPEEFSNLCLSLARRIDFAMAHQEIPNRSLELPSLLKKVCLWKNDTLLQATIIVLMISVKNASQSGWFSDRDSEEIGNIAKEIAGDFFIMSNFNTEPTFSFTVIDSIMFRFYPRIKMGQMFAFLEVKPGFDAYVTDFHLSKNLKTSPGDKIRLFVVQIDCIETSSCLTSPPKVNFLVNGHAVERRTNQFMDTGPQIPTVLTHLLRYGPNLLQAVGEFNGNYIIAVALMSEMPNADRNVLQDYEQQDSQIVDTDSDIIEGASRISIKCPISFRRIKTPVKGHSCRHIQCFDLDNYVDINSRRPSWRCPHCNQHVCFTDIRIDQKMVKILEEIGTNVTDIIVSSDGSWNAAMEIDGATQKPEDRTCDSGQNISPHPESVALLDVSVDILDLTQKDDQMDVAANHKTEDVKLAPNDLQNQLLTCTMAVNPHTTNTNDGNQNISGAEVDSWSRIYMSTFGQGSPNLQLNTQNLAAACVSTSNHIAELRVLTHTISAPHIEDDACDGNALVGTSASQSETYLSNTLHTQEYPIGNPTIANEYERFVSTPRHISRNPVADQATPSRASISSLQPTSRINTNTFMYNGLSSAYQASLAAPLPMQNGSPATVWPINQNVVTPASLRPTHQNVAPRPRNQIPNGYRGSIQHQSSSEQMMNHRIPRVSSQSPGTFQSSVQSPSYFLRPQHTGVSQDRAGLTAELGSQQADLIAAANRTMNMAFAAPVPLYWMNPTNRPLPSAGHHEATIAVGTQPAIMTDACSPADQNWRPSGRMRGALSGQAFTDAYREYIVQPNQQAQAAQSIPNVTSIPTNITLPMQSINAERAGHNLSEPYPPSAAGFMPDGST